MSNEKGALQTELVTWLIQDMSGKLATVRRRVPMGEGVGSPLPAYVKMDALRIYQLPHQSPVKDPKVGGVVATLEEILLVCGTELRDVPEAESVLRGGVVPTVEGYKVPETGFYCGYRAPGSNGLRTVSKVTLNQLVVHTSFHGNVVAEWPGEKSVYLFVKDASQALQEYLKHMSLWGGSTKAEPLARLTGGSILFGVEPELVHGWEIGERQLPAVREFLERTQEYRPRDCIETVSHFKRF